MMKFDKNNDGKLTKAEVTDQRLRRLFDRADADKDGIVTKAELTTLASQFQDREADGPPGFGPPGGFPPPGGGMMGGPPRPGEILPAGLRRNLKLTTEQTKQVDDLQKDVDAKIEKILNDDQKKQLKAMRQRGPGMFGGPGGRPPGFGRGRPGGAPDGPGDFGPPGGRSYDPLRPAAEPDRPGGFGPPGGGPPRGGPPDGQEPPPPPPDEK